MRITPEKLAEFKAIGPVGVLLEIAQGKHGHDPNSELWVSALTWAESEKMALDLEAASKRDEREERTLSMAREANSEAAKARSEARRANNIAIAAIMFSAAIAISASFIERGSLFPSNQSQAAVQCK